MVLAFIVKLKRWVALFMLALSVSACMTDTGVNYASKLTVPQYSYGAPSERNVSSSHLANAQYLGKSRDIPKQWWLVFNAPQLNTLMQLALNKNLDLLAARAALNAAREQLKAQTGLAFYPVITGQLNTTRGTNLASTATASNKPHNIFNYSFNLAYNLDLFGSSRYLVAALRAQAKYQEFMLAAAYLELTSNIATTSMQLALLNDSIALNKAMLKIQQCQLQLLKQQLRLGGASGKQLLLQAATVAATAAKLPPLQQLRSEAINLLGVLTATLPAKLPVNMSLTTLQLPKYLPLSVPSQVAQQRPDIGAAAALVAVASAQLGVATANLWPQFNLTASYGWSQNQLAALFSSSNLVWNIGAQLLHPIFNGGALRAQRRAAVANFVQAAAEYRRIVCQAFAAIANVLQDINNNTVIFNELAQAQQAAKQNFAIVQQQQNYGSASHLELLDAQLQYQQAALQLLQARAQRFITTINLFQVLGGGWWHNKESLER